jgi:hypothetical protein
MDDKRLGNPITGVIGKLSADEILVCQALRKYNQLRKFPLTDIEIVEWKTSLFELFPNLDPDAIKFVVLKMLIGVIESDGGGIQNIIKGLKRLGKNESGYFVKDDQVY